MPTETLTAEITDCVQLRGPNGETLATWYVIVSQPNKASFRVKPEGGPDSELMQIHKSRIANIRKGKGVPAPVEDETPEKEENEVAETATAEKPAATKAAAAKSKPAAVKPAAAKTEKEVESFDLNAWIKEHGPVHLSMPVKFDHKGFKVTSHVAIDEKGGYFHTINTYLHPDGRLDGKGGNKYPLKGHRLTRTVNKKGGKTESQVMKGTRTAEQIIAEKEKKGYKRVDSTGAKQVAAPAPAAAVAAPVEVAEPAAAN